MEKTKKPFDKKKIFSKKNIIIGVSVLLVIVLAVTGLCIWLANRNKGDFNSDPDFDKISKTYSTTWEPPTDGTTPADYAANENAFYAFGAMENVGSFITNSEGKAVTKLGVASVNQSIKATRIVNGSEVYKESISHSTFKSVAVRTFVKGDNYVVRDAKKVSSVNSVDWLDSANKVSQESFLQAWGAVPNSITLYILTEDTILSSEFLGEENGVFSYKYTLDPVAATGKIALEMRTMAGTDSMPSFSEVNLTIKMNAKWRVMETLTDCTYRVDMLGGVTCTETLAEVFSGYEEGTQIPDVEFYRAYLDAEVTEPVEKAETALDYIMEGFEPYITGGAPLKARLQMHGGESLPLNLNGAVELSINIEDLSAINVKADVESVTYEGLSFEDIFIGYQNGKVYLSAADFKGYGSIEEMGGVLNRLLPIFDLELNTDSLFSGMDLESLIQNAVLTENENRATVSLPIELGEMSIAVQLVFETQGEEIVFVGGEVSLGEISITLINDETVSIADIGEDYHNIAPLFELIDENGCIQLNVDVAGVNALVNFDVTTLTADINLEDLVAKYAEETIYINYKGLKAKLAIADIEPAMQKLKPILENYVDLSALETLGEGVDVMSMLGGALDELTIVEAENELVISTTVENAAVELVLGITDRGYVINAVNITLDDITVSATPTTEEITAITMDESYHSILPLLDMIDENGCVQLSVGVAGVNALVNFDITTLTADVNLEDLVAKYAEETIYLNYKGLKAKLALADIEPAIQKLQPILENYVDLSALETLGEGIDVMSMLGGALNELAIFESENELVISTTVESVAVELVLGITDRGYIVNAVNIVLDDIAVSATPTTEEITAITMDESYHSILPLLDMIDENGCVQLNVNVAGVNALVNFDITTLTADINLEDLVAKYAEETIYINYKGLKAKLAIADIEPAMQKLKPILENYVDLSALETLGEGIDVMSMLGGALDELTIVEAENELVISTTVENAAVELVLGITDRGYVINAVNITLDDIAVSATPTAEEITAITKETLSEYKSVVGLLKLLDEESRISLELDVGNLIIPVTLDLKSMELYAAIDAVEIYVNLNTGDIYARYPGIKAAVNFNDFEEIVEKLQPLLDKFLGENVIPTLDLDGMSGISAEDILSKIVIVENGTTTSVSLSIADIYVAVDFSTETDELLLDCITLTLDEMQISAKQAEKALHFEFDTSEDYIDLKELVDNYGEILTDLLAADSLSISLDGSVTMGGDTYVIRDSYVKIDKLSTTPRASAMLTLDIQSTLEDGSIKTTTHVIKLIYLDPSLVAAGATNVYFTYDNTADSGIMEGMFTTEKAENTWNVLKQIYAQMPDVQALLKPIVTPDENGMPTMMDMRIDLASLFHLIAYADNQIHVDINGGAFGSKMPESILLQMNKTENGLGVSLPSLKLGEMALSLNASVALPQENEITDETFAYNASSSASDFSSIDTLLQTLANTSNFRSFDIEGTVNMSVLGLININDKIHLEAKMDIVEEQVYAAVTIRRDYVLTAWNDYDGYATLYYNPSEQMIYIKDVSTTRSRKYIWSSWEYKTTYTYTKYTVDEFMADPMTPLFGMLHFSDTINNAINDGMAKDSTGSASLVTIENTFKGYSYNGTDTFCIDLDLEPMLTDIQDVRVEIKHDKDYNISSLYANAELVSVIDLSLNASLQTPYNQYQGVPEEIAAEKASGNYA